MPQETTNTERHTPNRNPISDFLGTVFGHPFEESRQLKEIERDLAKLQEQDARQTERLARIGKKPEQPRDETPSSPTTEQPYSGKESGSETKPESLFYPPPFMPDPLPYF